LGHGWNTLGTGLEQVYLFQPCSNPVSTLSQYCSNIEQNKALGPTKYEGGLGLGILKNLLQFLQLGDQIGAGFFNILMSV